MTSKRLVWLKNNPTRRKEMADQKRILLRIVDPVFGPNNVYRSQAKKIFPLGPVMVGTVAARKIPWLDVEIIGENNYRGPLTEEGLPDHWILQEERKADLIGISASITNAVPRALEVIRDYLAMFDDLKPQAVIVGGWHAGVSPREFLAAGAAVVVHGEGEIVIASLILALRERVPLGNIPGISFWKDGNIQRNPPDFLTLTEEELNDLPHPDFGLVRYAKIKIYPVSYGRGCNGRCRFCLVKSSHRHLSPERFLEQIMLLVSKGARKFFVVDDRIEEDLEGFRRWLQELWDFRRRRKIRRLNLTVQCRLTLAEHPDLLKLMTEAGVRTVAIGFESPLRDQLIAMRKPLSHRKMIEHAKAFRRAGLYVHMMLIFGYPTSITGAPSPIKRSAEELAKAFLRFMLKVPSDTAQVLFYVPIPGTEDWYELKKRGRIFSLDWSFYDGTWVVFVPDNDIDPIELQKKGVELTRRYYAYKWIWRFGWLTLLIHLFRIGTVVPAMPFIWLMVLPFYRNIHLAWRVPLRKFRRVRKHFMAHWVILAWLRSFRRLKKVLKGAYQRKEA